jgi:hypothetical protein
MTTDMTCEAVNQLPEGMALAVIRHAERQADLVAAHVNATDEFLSAAERLPAAFFLEFAAVLEIGLWELRDLRRHINMDLPWYHQAADELVARCRKGPREFEGPNATPLTVLVLNVWIESFAWDGPDLLGTEIILDEGDQDDDDFIDLLAEFVWTHHRHELQHLISEKRQI